MLQPPLKPCAKTSETVDTQLFAHYFIYFVPSIRFSEKRARLLLMRLKENGGNGSVCEHGEKGFQEAHTNHLSASSKLCSHIILCADPTLISKFSHTTSIPARPPKWLLESFRHQSIKSPDLYKCLSPRTVTNPSFTPTPRAGKRKYSDCTPEVPPSNTPSARKRVRTSPIGNRHDVAEVEAVKLLFPSPSRLPDVPSSRLVAIGSASKLAATRKMNWACEVRTSFGKCEVRMNDKICELLAVVQQSYVAKKDHFRAVGYQRAIAKIRSLEHDILTVQDVSSLGEQKSIGSKMERKVLEIVKTGRLQQAESVLNNVDYIAVKTLCDVWGIGPVKAMSLVSQGIKSIEQLRNVAKESPDLLDRNQTIGLKLYEDLLHRIPRNEVADLEMFVRKVVKSVDASLDITVAGSYLRGKESCGDVDILIYGSQDRLRKGFSNVKNALRKSGVLTDDLIDGHAKYFGVFKFAGRRHGRVDLFAVPDEQYPYALLTYTGSAIFNRFVLSLQNLHSPIICL